MYGFEWDEHKRIANVEKHGIDFVDAIEVFNDFDRIEAEIVRNGERRNQVIGLVKDVIIFVVYTKRNDKQRIISARRASRYERETYFQPS
ncbi:MAG: BrnT family toxin [Gammaproteobacteria bacterium]|nr:BrnT family toxin [Gammaproteobacteria bacterium]